MVDIVGKGFPPMQEGAFDEPFQDNGGKIMTTEGIRRGLDKTEDMFTGDSVDRMKASGFYVKKAEA